MAYTVKKPINQEIKEVKDSIDILEVVGKHVKLERRGKNYFGLCPFHDDKNPSMSVNVEKGIFTCFSCGTKGDAIIFNQKIKGITYEESIKELSGKTIDYTKKEPTSIEKIYKEVGAFYEYNLHNSESGKEALQYLFSRGFDINTIKAFNLGLATTNDTLYTLLTEKGYTSELIHETGLINKHKQDFFKGRLIFPIKNTENNVVGFSGRTLKDDKVKYYNTEFKKGETLYNLGNALGEIRKQDYVVITEGFFDVMRSFDVGVKNVVATMGTAITEEHVKEIGKYTKNVVLAFDPDEAGKKATLSAIKKFGDDFTVNIFILHDKDLAETLTIEEHKQAYIKRKTTDKFNYVYSNAQKEDLTNVYNILKLKKVVDEMPKEVQFIFRRKFLKDCKILEWLNKKRKGGIAMWKR